MQCHALKHSDRVERATGALAAAFAQRLRIDSLPAQLALFLVPPMAEVVRNDAPDHRQQVVALIGLAHDLLNALPLVQKVANDHAEEHLGDEERVECHAHEQVEEGIDRRHSEHLSNK